VVVCLADSAEKLLEENFRAGEDVKRAQTKEDE
jgi:hypothetical protein